MQIVLTQGFRAGMEPGEPTSPGPCQQEWDPCEQDTGRALELRAGLDRDIYREIEIYINPLLLGSRMESGQCGACIAPVPAGSTCRLQEGWLPCVSSRSSSPNSVLGCGAEWGEELCPQQTDPFPSAAPLQSCLLHTRKCLISLSRGSLICGGNPIPPCLPGIGMASRRVPRSLRQKRSSGQPRYRGLTSKRPRVRGR